MFKFFNIKLKLDGDVGMLILQNYGDCETN